MHNKYLLIKLHECLSKKKKSAAPEKISRIHFTKTKKKTETRFLINESEIF